MIRFVEPTNVLEDETSKDLNSVPVSAATGLFEAVSFLCWLASRMHVRICGGSQVTFLNLPTSEWSVKLARSS